MADDVGRGKQRQAQAGRRYAAFISYSHRDEEFGDWLHKRLESYQVPSALAGRASSVGAIGRRLGKVFRDRADLSAAHDLGREIREGLEQSDALIVLCSPRSCGSKYVQDEIRTFKQLGKGHRIFAAIIDGEPHAAGRPGYTAADECFPPSLIFALNPDGSLSSSPEPTEPIAADFREGKDGRENGSLKLIAGLLDVGLDELVQRERQAERKRRLRAYAFGMAMAALSLGAVLLGGVAFWQRAVAIENEVRALQNERRALLGEEQARTARIAAERNAQEREIQRLLAEANGAEALEQRTAAQNTLYRFFATRGWTELEAGNPLIAARYALAGLRLSPANAVEYHNLLNVLAHRIGEQSYAEHNAIQHALSTRGGGFITADYNAVVEWSPSPHRLHRTLGDHDTLMSMSMSPDERFLATIDRTMIRIFDRASGEVVISAPRVSFGASNVIFSSNSARAVIVGASVSLWDLTNSSLLATLDDSNNSLDVSFAPDGARVAVSNGPTFPK